MSVRALLIVALGTCAVSCSALPAGEAQTPEELVRQLNSDNFDKRAEAAEKLEALGEAARAALLRARRSDTLEVSATAKRLLERLKTARLDVLVVDEDGNPRPRLNLSGELVSSGNVGEIRPVTIETDPDGRLTLKSPLLGHHLLRLGASGSEYTHTSFWQPTMLDLHSGTNRLNWVYPRDATIKGQVVAARTGEPVGEIGILTRNDDGAPLDDPKLDENGQPFVFETTSDAKGEFSIANIQPGVVRVYAMHADYVPGEGPALLVKDNRTYTLSAPIRLERKADVWGRLRIQALGSDGKPAAKVKAKLHLIPLTAHMGPAADEVRSVEGWSRLLEGRKPQAFETDNDGWLETTWLKPGSYRLLLEWNDLEQPDAKPSQCVDHGTVIVKAGETLRVPSRNASKTGALTGRITCNDGSFWFILCPLNMDDPFYRDWLRASGAFQRTIAYQLSGLTCGTQDLRQGSEAFVVDGLRPGRYTLVFFSMCEGRIGCVFGLEVREGQTTDVGEVDLNGEPHARLKLRGAVLDENGKRLAKATWSIRRLGYGELPVSHGETFEAESPEDTSHVWLIFSCPGYRLKAFDLNKPIPNPEWLAIQLQPQRYGVVDVTVRDPEGRPLEDAEVFCFSYGSGAKRSQETGLDGRAKLRGLADGKRRFRANLEGFYLEKPVRVDIKPDQTNALEIVLKPGIQFTGRVAIPPGTDSRNVLAWIHLTDPELNTYSWEVWRSAAVDEKGVFRFDGLKPGSARLRVQAPGLISAEQEVVVKAGATAEVRLVKPATVIVDAGPAGRGGLLFLRSGRLGPLVSFDEDMAEGASCATTGLAVFTGVLPGVYDLAFLRNEKADERTCQAWVVSPCSMKVEEGQLSTCKIDLQPGHSVVKLRVQAVEHGVPALVPPSGMLFLQGSRAYAHHYLNSLLPDYSQEQKVWSVRGPLPEGFHADASEVDVVKGLPAGTYKLFASSRGPGRERVSEGAPVLVKTFELKDNETLDLGTLRIEFPPYEQPDRPDEIGEDEPLE